MLSLSQDLDKLFKIMKGFEISRMSNQVYQRFKKLINLKYQLEKKSLLTLIKYNHYKMKLKARKIYLKRGKNI